VGGKQVTCVTCVRIRTAESCFVSRDEQNRRAGAQTNFFAKKFSRGRNSSTIRRLSPYRTGERQKQPRQRIKVFASGINRNIQAVFLLVLKVTRRFAIIFLIDNYHSVC
jgi:hypothetical protein